MRKPALSALLFLTLALPAQAHLLYLKDGRQLEGTIRVENGNIILKNNEGQETTYTADAVQGISLDNQPLFTPPARAEESKYLNNDWLVWSVVGVNALTMATSAVGLYRAWATTKPANP